MRKINFWYVNYGIVPKLNFPIINGESTEMFDKIPQKIIFKIKSQLIVREIIIIMF